MVIFLVSMAVLVLCFCALDSYKCCKAQVSESQRTRNPTADIEWGHGVGKQLARVRQLSQSLSRQASAGAEAIKTKGKELQANRRARIPSHVPLLAEAEPVTAMRVSDLPVVSAPASAQPITAAVYAGQAPAENPEAAEPDATTSEMRGSDSLRTVLESAKLGHWAERLEEAGYQEVDDLREAEESDLLATGLAIVEVRRLRRKCRQAEKPGRTRNPTCELVDATSAV